MLICQQTACCSNIEKLDKKLSVASPQLEYCDEWHLRMAELSRPIPRVKKKCNVFEHLCRGRLCFFGKLQN